MDRLGALRGRICRSTVPAMAAAGVLFAAGPLHGQRRYGLAVEQTAHDLSRTAQVSPMSGMIANYGSACVHCHTPNGGAVTRPNWSRRLPTGPYRTYESGTLDMPADLQPGGSTRRCLSYHDGTVGLDDVANRPGTFAGPGPFDETTGRCTSCHHGGHPAGGFNRIPNAAGSQCRVCPVGAPGESTAHFG